MQNTTKTNIIVNPDSNQLIASHTEDITGWVEELAEKRNAAEGKPMGDMPLLASFPGVLIEKYCFQNGIKWSDWIEDPIHCRRMLADPALAAFRVTKGHF